MEAPEKYNHNVGEFKNQVDILRRRIVDDLRKQPILGIGEYCRELSKTGQFSHIAVNEALFRLLLDRTIVHDYPEDVVSLNLETLDFHYQN